MHIKTQRINAIRDHFLNTPDLPAFLRQWDATAATHGFARDVQSTKNWYDYTLKMKAARVFWDGIVDADRV